MAQPFKFASNCKKGMIERGVTAIPRSCPVHGLLGCTPIQNPTMPRKEAPVLSEEETRSLISHGFATGNYLCNCDSCEETFSGDKRAIRCYDCAVKLRSGHRKAIRDQMLENLKDLSGQLADQIHQNRMVASDAQAKIDKLSDRRGALLDAIKELEANG